MFTWICPECHREVLPSYAECPTCAERKRAAAGPPPTPPPPQQQPPQRPPQQPQYAQQPPQYAPPARPQQAYPAAPPPPPQYAQQPVYAPPPPAAAYTQPQAYAPPQPPPPQQPQYAQQPPPPVPALLPVSHERSGPAPWMVVVLVTAILVGGGYLLYTFVLSGNRGVPAAAAAKSAAPGKADPSAQGHPYAKWLEVVGVRLTETGNKPVMKMLVVNHSAADMTGLELKGTLGVVNGKPDDPPVATFTAKVGSIGPYESKDVSAEVSTKMRAYELPDWQFLNVKYDITSPR